MPERTPVPPLPAGWPYTHREAGRALEAAPGACLGPGWILCTSGPISLEGESSPLSDAFGRGGIKRVGEVVVRPYRRGGLVRHINERIYASPARFAREYEVHQALWSAGFPTVEPLGYGYRRRAWGVEGVFLTRFVAAPAWPTCWEPSAELLPQLDRLLDALARWGLLAPDLNATNILRTVDGRILALDWDRARWTGAEDLRARYQERLRRSLLKLRAPASVLDSFARLSTG